MSDEQEPSPGGSPSTPLSDAKRQKMLAKIGQLLPEAADAEERD